MRLPATELEGLMFVSPYIFCRILSNQVVSAQGVVIERVYHHKLIKNHLINDNQ